jgi:integrase
LHLTQKVVDSVALDGDGIYWDDDVSGLGHRVQARRRTWVVRYRVAGMQRQRTLAPGDLPLKKARELAAEVVASARRGEDVVERGRAAAVEARREKEERRRALEAQQTRRLAVIVEDYIRYAETTLRPRTVRELKRYLLVHWEPLHEQVADELDRRTIVGRLEEIASENGPTAANRAQSYLSMACAWALNRARLDRNPVLGIKKLSEERPRDRVLTADALRAVWNAADPATLDGRIVRLLMLTGQRLAEVSGMRWGEIDEASSTWRIPKERTKNGRAHEVPLSPAALELVRSSPRLEGSDFVFPGRKGAFRGAGGLKRRLDGKSGVTRWVLHDFRRTVVTHMAEETIAPPHVIEAIVNHTSGHKGGVAGVYNRAAYAAEKRHGLERWARHLTAVISNAERKGSLSCVTGPIPLHCA